MRIRPAAGLVCTVLVAACAGCGVLQRQPEPGPAAEAFTTALRRGTVDADTLTQPGQAPAARRLLRDLTEELGGPPQFPLIGPVEPGSPSAAAGDGRPQGATARLRVRWRLPVGTWAYDTKVPMVLVDGGWKVRWSPAVLHPDLRSDRTLRLRPTTPMRGPILSADGQRLFTLRPVVTVYVQPRRMRDLRQVLDVLETTLDIDRGPLRQRVEAAEPDELVEVVTLRVEDYAPLRTTLRPVPGLVFRRGDQPLTPYRAFARAVLGRVGAPTAEVLEEVGFGFGPGDRLGLSGLQRTFQDELAGRPGVRVVVVDAQGGHIHTVHEVAPGRGEALRTTLEIDAQTAADAALVDLRRPSALVAVRASTGAIIAVANGPDGGAVNHAFTGRYPPGSTFKVVSTAALLGAGLRPDDPVTCPPTATVGGREFRNAEGDAAGDTTFRVAFAESCNTTMVQLATDVDDAGMASTARAFGFDGGWDPGVAAFAGQVPPPRDDVERAAAAIGQGRVLASPLLMATVAAAVADGAWRAPVLLPDHAHPSTPAETLDRAALRTLRRLMRAVVNDGTGGALAGVDGPPVLAKTGTAEYGTQDPPQTHAWVIAARGDVAVAVLVEGGGGGAAVAAPIAAAFLDAL